MISLLYCNTSEVDRPYLFPTLRFTFSSACSWSRPLSSSGGLGSKMEPSVIFMELSTMCSSSVVGSLGIFFGVLLLVLRISRG